MDEQTEETPIDTRVGYASIDMIVGMLEEYIKLHIDDNKFVGDPKYLMLHYQFKAYLATPSYE